MRTNIEINDAIERMLALPVRCRTELIPLSEALGRVSAKTINAQEMIPPFDRSPFDGFAFRSEDTSLATTERPVTLSIVEEIPAGKMPTVTITRGKAAKILTGAPMPNGADATIKYEHTEFLDKEVRIFHPVVSKDVVPAGEDITINDLVVAKGEVLTPSVMGLLAALGETVVPVYERPVVGMINTGTELLEENAPAAPGKIRNSSLYTLGAYLHTYGLEIRNGGIVDDDPGLIEKRILDLLGCSDMVITTGGASVGDYDWMLRVMEQLKADILFERVAMKPGGSMIAAVFGGKLILCLSGNPGSAVTSLIRIGLPYIKKLSGRDDYYPQFMELKLKESFNKASKSIRLLRGRLVFEEGLAFFLQAKGQGGGIISSFKQCDLLGEIPAGTLPLPAGTKIAAFRI
jgi:molybdopterin molybdotransferase